MAVALLPAPDRETVGVAIAGAAMFTFGKVTGKQRVFWLGACLSNASNIAVAEPVCVTCAKPVLNVQCEIRKSQSLDGLPFADKLTAKACVKAVKASSEASGCHVAKDTACPNWPLKSFSLREAKQALLGEMPPASAADDQDAKAAAAAAPTETKWSSFLSPLAHAWEKFLAVTWR